MARSLTMEEVFYIGIVNLLENEELLRQAINENNNEQNKELYKGASIGIRMFLRSLGYNGQDIQRGIEAVKKGEVSLDFMKEVKNGTKQGLH